MPSNCESICSPNFLLKWILVIWLALGIGLYLLDMFWFTSTIPNLFNVPSVMVFVLAIINNLLLMTAIVLEIRFLLIAAILFDCALLVALPALIVEVMPNLLTYASLMVSIIFSIVHGVLYMQNPLFDVMIADEQGYNFLSEPSRERHSYNLARSNAMDERAGGLPTVSGSIPRHSCQF